jgi:hypothetical protein
MELVARLYENASVQNWNDILLHWVIEPLQCFAIVCSAAALGTFMSLYL